MKDELINNISNEIKKCRKCRLWQNAKNPVSGEGNLESPIMFIGEAPGQDEDLTGRPFVGRAGKLLDKLFDNIGLKREDIYIANVIKHRPPDNRQPQEDEIKICTPYLDEQIKIIQPKIIVTLGKYSTNYILSKGNIYTKGKSQTQLRYENYNVILFGNRIRVIPTFHPAAALHNPKNMVILKEDFKKIERELKNHISLYRSK